MRIAVLLPGLEPGGVELAMCRVAAGLAERGHQVELVVVDGSEPGNLAVTSGIRVRNLGKSRAIHALAPLVRYLRQAQPDVLISAKDYVNVIAIWARRLARVGTRVFVTCHSPLFAPQEGQPGWMGRQLVSSVRLSYPLADGLIAVSESVAGDLRNACRGVPVTVISNPTLPPDLDMLATEPTGLAWLDEGSACPVVLSIGRLATIKNHELVIQAFAQLVESRPARLVILGEGPNRQRLLGLVSELDLAETVFLPGNVANPFAFIGRASVLAITSKSEAIPMVLIEALALGTPVVSTPCSPTAIEYLRDGTHGRLVPFEAVGELAEALRSEMSVASRRIPPELAEFRVATAVDAYAAVIGAV